MCEVVNVSSVRDTYEQWLHNPNLDEGLRTELEHVTSEEDIEDRFYKNLEFGTGGMRGILGAGINRMNLYTVRRATLGLARFLLQQGDTHAKKGVAVGYDCRRMSQEFANDIGAVLAAQGIPSYIFEHLCPTPELSYAVRTLGTAAGIVVTASHNPPEYNGYKVYGSDGGQLLPDAAAQIIEQVESIQDIFSVPVMDKEEAIGQGLMHFVGEDMDEAYIQAVLDAVLQPPVQAAQRASLNIVYTPLHGTGNVPVRETLRRAGYSNTVILRSQEQPDGEFPTVASPNPEEPEALKLAIAEAGRQKAHLVMGTDPDADRVGIAVRAADGQYRLLTGNQVGGLLVDFVLKMKQETGLLPTNGIVFKTIVTSQLGSEAAKAYGVAVEDTLTGFKYIGNRIGHYEATGEHTFVFGYEESYGYLASPMVRDKDAVQICLLIAEMATYYKSQGMSLLDALQDLYRRVGYFREILVSEKLPGADGMAKMQSMLDDLRHRGLRVPGLALIAVEDYLRGIRQDMATGRETPLTLPRENVLKYFFDNHSWLAIRPSGTEPKIKVYIGVRGNSETECEAVLQVLRQAVSNLLQ